MDLINTIHRRRSAKKFHPNTPDKEQLQTVIEAARFAHSIGNRQLLRYSVCLNKVKCREIAQFSNLLFTGDIPSSDINEHIAPAYIICSAPLGCSDLIYADIGAAFQNMALAAMSEKLSMYYINQFNKQNIENLFPQDDNKQILALFAIGTAAESYVAYNAESLQEHVENPGDSRIIHIPKLRASQITTWIE